MNEPKYQFGKVSVMIIIDGEPHTLTKGQANYETVLTAVQAEDWETVRANLTVGKTIEQWADGEFTVVNGEVCYQGNALPPALNERILKMVTKGDDPRPMMRVWERLDKNPSYRSVEQLFDFLMKNPGIPFTPDGFILFYKGVRPDFRDCHSGKFDNSPGQHLKMKRNRVSDDPTKPCHFGFHVGARSYAASFGTGQTVIVKVDPKDVVCVPDDCSQQKVRICEYWVVGVDNGGLLPDTVMEPDVITPEPKGSDLIGTDEATGEPPVDPNEPLVAPVDLDPIESIRHTDGSRMKEGETLPKDNGEEAAVKLPLTGTAWDYMNDMDTIELADQSLMSLRRYGRNNCLIIGASKRPGGKTWLVPAIIKARGYADPADRK